MTNSDTPEGKKPEKKKPKYKPGPVFGEMKVVDGLGEGTVVPKIEVHPRADRHFNSKYQPEWMIDKIIEVGRYGGSITQVAVSIGVTRDTLWRWSKTYEEVSDALKIAGLLSQAWWEENGRIATFGGFEGFNSTSYIFQMKNRFPEFWRDVKQNEITGAYGGPVQVDNASKIDVKRLAPEKREALKQMLLTLKEETEEEEED